MSEMTPEPHTECRCGRPTRDGAWTCDTCGDQLTQALAELPWLTTELNTTLTGTKGVDYRRSGGTPSSEPRLPLHLAASELLTDIHGTLTSWVRFCHDTKVRNQSPEYGLPADNIPAMSRYLMWRVDGLALLEKGNDAVAALTKLGERGKQIIDQPADKWYAGPCAACNAPVYATVGTSVVSCRNITGRDSNDDAIRCGHAVDVANRRATLLVEAEDRLLTAAGLARAVSWLGATPLTGDRVRKWAERGRILAHGHDGRYPLYRVGDAINLLADTTKAG